MCNNSNDARCLSRRSLSLSFGKEAVAMGYNEVSRPHSLCCLEVDFSVITDDKPTHVGGLS